jgi:hypothetical protein
LEDEDAWMRASVTGIRRVMKEHTYSKRTKYLLEQTGIKYLETFLPPLSIVAIIDDLEDVDRFATVIANQTYQDTDIVVLSKISLDGETLQKLSNTSGQKSVANVILGSENLYSQCLDKTRAEYVAFLNIDDYYGPNYLKDFALAIMYSDANFLGKSSYYENPGNDSNVNYVQKGDEFRYVDKVLSSTLIARKTALSEEVFRNCLRHRSFTINGYKILSIDGFNYIKCFAKTKPSEKAVKTIEF